MRVVGTLLGAGLLLVVGACTERGETQTPPVSTEPATTLPRTSSTTTTTTTTTSTTAPPTTTTTTTTTSTTTTTIPPTTEAPTSTTTTEAPPPPAGVGNPGCVVQINAGDSLSTIAAAVPDDAVTVESLQAENAITDPNTIHAGGYLDVCVGNEIDDITGAPRVPPTIPPPAAAGGSGVQAQQQKLNELFAGLGLPALAVDGDSGRLTEQQLCAARVALNLPVSRADMEPGGVDEQALMASGSLSIPATAPVSASKWALIDQTCQIMFVGEGGDRLVFVLRTSTGESGHETRNQRASRVFRFDPARENNGWHDSTHYPVPEDNPLNGNMYKPLYFDGGQAIHGANNVPPSPQSKGCARLRVESQDALIDWLGLGDVAGPVWDAGNIDLTVSVQGHY